MFSANENLMLRQHKRRIIEYVEELLPSDILDMGTTVMVMQVSCKVPGCVPLETIIMIVFPNTVLDNTNNNNNNNNNEVRDLLENIVDMTSFQKKKKTNDGNKGPTFKTKILLPMADVTRDDVVMALPPPLGTCSLEQLCVRARDVMISQITQLMGDDDDVDDVEGRTMMANYLQASLEEYKKRGCIAPEYGRPYPDDADYDDISSPTTTNSDGTTKMTIPATTTSSSSSPSTDTTTTTNDRTTTNGTTNNHPIDFVVPRTGNFVFRRDPQDDATTATAVVPKTTCAEYDMTTTDGSSTKNNNNNTTTKGESSTAVNNNNSGSNPSNDDTTTTTTAPRTLRTSTTMDWRRRQDMEKEITSLSSQSIITKLANREHAPGVRMAGCPCCDPDNVSNYVDTMMML